MHLLLLLPFLIQAIAIGLDEVYFHIKRGLPLWERIGHPLDTLSVIVCLCFVLFVPYSPLSLKWYIGLCIFSCLMITKDEWIHKHHCPASEQWLHALLFINHPILLTSMGLIWWVVTTDTAPLWLQGLSNQKSALTAILLMQLGFICIFFLYQVIYWNFIWKKNKIST